MKQVLEDIMYEKYDLMEDNIQKNIRELAEYCVDNDIYCVDELVEIIEHYKLLELMVDKNKLEVEEV